MSFSYIAPVSDVDTLLMNADHAMYEAKQSGDGDMFYCPVIETPARLLSLEQDLHYALERKQFILHYQPKVALATHAIAGAEVLLR